ncbi:MAG: S8 family serine peptidase, partial [Acidimicrobiia bacterium]
MLVRRFSRLSALLAAALVAALLGVAPASGAQAGANFERLVVLLEGDPVATALGTVHGPEADAYRAELAAGRAALKDWMQTNVPQAQIVWEYDTVLNAVSVDLQGADAAALAAGPGVRQVLHPTWMQPVMDTSLPLVNWDDATGFTTSTEDVPVGEGVFVGIIDSGIDQDHPFFDDSGPLFQNSEGSCKYAVADPGQTQFTSCKVLVAKVFHPDETSAEAIESHGTHVAGTAGGVSNTASDTGAMSGAAPAALLGNYNVFPGTVASASSDDIAVAVEVAVEDGMDVLNLSLGGSPLAGYDA